MHIPYPDAVGPEKFRQILRHLFRESCHQHPLVPLGPGADLLHQIVDLALYRAHLHPGVQQSGGADDLLHDVVRPLPLVRPRRGGDEHRLTDAALKFLEFQRPVVEGAGQAEAVPHQRFLSGPVAVVHGPDLRQRHMALVHKQQEIIRKEVQQGHRGAARRTVGDDPGIVLNTGAIPQLPHHFHVVFRPLADALGLHQHLIVIEIFYLVLQFRPDLAQGLLHLLLGGDVVAGGVDGHMVQHPVHRTGEGVKVGDPVDLIPEELHPDGVVLIVGGVDLHRVPPHPEPVPLEGHVVPLVAVLHQTAQQLVPVPLRPLTQRNHHLGEVVRLAQAVNAGHGGHHDHVPPLQQGTGSGQPQAVDLIIGRCVLGNIGIRVGDIGLRLVVIVVGDKILHGVVGEKLLEFRTKLGCQCLIVGQHQRRPLDLLNDLGHGVGLAGAGDA